MCVCACVTERDGSMCVRLSERDTERERVVGSAIHFIPRSMMIDTISLC